MPLLDTLLLEHDDIPLTVYQGKNIKNVLLLSSPHPTVDIGNNHPKKASRNNISFYNSTKFSDIADQMARKYSVQAGSRRWPVHVFYNILDLAGNNSWILYKEVTEAILSRMKKKQRSNGKKKEEKRESPILVKEDLTSTREKNLLRRKTYENLIFLGVMARLQSSENAMLSRKNGILCPQHNREDEILKENLGTSAEKLGIEEDY
ncbi:catenin alpha [Trichonephila clavipes]|nr:catenin alpha [Trichonephila clavipes]